MSSKGLSLSGRTVLVTGASSGLGEHLARLCATNGASVVAAARRTERLQALVDTLPASGGPHVALQMDVTDEKSVLSAFDEADRRDALIDTVIANAGVSAPGLAVDLPITEFDAAFGVNTRGTFLVAREAAKRMMARGDGRDNRMILVASIGGLVPLAGVSTYSASKAATVMLGRALAREWINKGISVNVLCPGYIRTDLNSDWFDSEAGKRQIASFPRRRLMQAGDLDDLVIGLAGRGSYAVTGSVITLDDGQTL